MPYRIGQFLDLRAPRLLTRISEITGVPYGALQADWNDSTGTSPSLGLFVCGAPTPARMGVAEVAAPYLSHLADLGINRITLGDFAYWDGVEGIIIPLDATIPPSHHPLGPGEESLSHSYVASTLLPDWWSMVAPGGRVTHTGEGLEADLGRFGSWDGLFWRKRYPAKVLRWAISTLWHGASTASGRMSAVACKINPTFIQSFIDGVGTPVGRWTPPIFSTDWSRGLCNPTVFDVPRLQVDRASGLLVQDPLNTFNSNFGAFNNPGHGVAILMGGVAVPITQEVVFCLSSAWTAARADYYFWWARRLLYWAELCQSPWWAFMAILCARQGLLHIIEQSALLLHELAHTSENVPGTNHCQGHACCYDWIKFDYSSALIARFALPSIQTGYRQDEWTDFLTTPSAGCKWTIPGRTMQPMRYETQARHCNLFKENRFVQLTTSIRNICVAGSSAPTGTTTVGSAWRIGSMYVNTWQDGRYDCKPGIAPSTGPPPN
jgi:hypothetical protein